MRIVYLALLLVVVNLSTRAMELDELIGAPSSPLLLSRKEMVIPLPLQPLFAEKVDSTGKTVYQHLEELYKAQGKNPEEALARTFQWMECNDPGLKKFTTFYAHLYNSYFPNISQARNQSTKETISNLLIITITFKESKFLTQAFLSTKMWAYGLLNKEEADAVSYLKTTLQSLATYQIQKGDQIKFIMMAPITFMPPSLLDQLPRQDIKSLELYDVAYIPSLNFPNLYRLVIDNKCEFLVKENKKAIELAGIPSRITELKNLRILEFIDTGLNEIPQEMRLLTQLARLALIGNKLTTFPNTIESMTNLQELSLADMLIKALPESIKNNTKLEKLACMKLGLTSLPENFSLLANLTLLNLSDNQLTQVPEQVKLLTRLRVLNLSGNPISKLESWISALQQLIALSADHMALSALPAEIVLLSKLKELSLSHNQFAFIPKQVVELMQKFKTKIYFYDNPASVYPQEYLLPEFNYIPLPSPSNYLHKIMSEDEEYKREHNKLVELVIWTLRNSTSK